MSFAQKGRNNSCPTQTLGCIGLSVKVSTHISGCQCFVAMTVVIVAITAVLIACICSTPTGKAVTRSEHYAEYQAAGNWELCAKW